MRNKVLHKAKKAKNDEFYTRYVDIEKEISAYLEYDENVFRDKTILLPCDDPEWSDFTKYFAQNFERLGLKKLISTSYAANSKPKEILYQPTLFESQDPKFDENKTRTHGKIFELNKDTNHDKKINIEDLKWKYLKGDGDFRSEEIKKLRDESDIVVTNPPLSLFRDFLSWILEADKKFIIIGNMNAITYKEVFPYIKDTKIWIGATNFNTGMYFKVPDNFVYAPTYKFLREIDGFKVSRVPGLCWYTNIDHGRRHQPIPLMTMEDNLRFSKHKEIREHGYIKYDNYDAIEVPYTDAIPSDYRKGMGVPISFLDKFCPEQFEIVKFRKGDDGKDLRYNLLERERERGQLRLTSESSSGGKRINGVMGVPISFLAKYCPEQFEIIGATESEGKGFSNGIWDESSGVAQPLIEGQRVYKRIFIKARI